MDTGQVVPIGACVPPEFIPQQGEGAEQDGMDTQGLTSESRKENQQQEVYMMDDQSRGQLTADAGTCHTVQVSTVDVGVRQSVLVPPVDVSVCQDVPVPTEDVGVCHGIPVTTEDVDVCRDVPFPPVDHGVCQDVPVPREDVDVCQDVTVLPVERGVCQDVPVSTEDGVCQDVPVPPVDHGVCQDVPVSAEDVVYQDVPVPPVDHGDCQDVSVPTEDVDVCQDDPVPIEDVVCHTVPVPPVNVAFCQDVQVPPMDVGVLQDVLIPTVDICYNQDDLEPPVDVGVYQGRALSPALVQCSQRIESQPWSKKQPGRQQQQNFPPLAQPQISMDRKEERMRIGQSASTGGTRQEGHLLARSEMEFAEVEENYLRGCKWSADGTMLLTNSNDNVMRVFNMSSDVFDNKWNVNMELRSSLKVREMDMVYDFAWHPCMTLSHPDSCVFVTTVRQAPIHMFSAISGQHVANYRAYNDADEIEAAHSIGFTSDGRHLMAGFNRKLRCFDVNRPGRDCVRVSTVSGKDPITHRVEGQRGILSCFAAHPNNPRLMAAGAFNGDVAIYEASSCNMTTLFAGQTGGITHVTFTKDGNYLFAGGRKDPEINCFDLRNPENILYVLYRYVATNQRIYFDVDRESRYLLSGHHNGHVTTWDLNGETRTNDLVPWPRLDPVSHFVAHMDTVNGLHIHPCLPVLATCSGQRHFPESLFRDADDSSPSEPDVVENSLKLWRLSLP